MSTLILVADIGLEPRPPDPRAKVHSVTVKRAVISPNAPEKVAGSWQRSSWMVQIIDHAELREALGPVGGWPAPSGVADGTQASKRST